MESSLDEFKTRDIQEDKFNALRNRDYNNFCDLKHGKASKRTNYNYQVKKSGKNTFNSTKSMSSLTKFTSKLSEPQNKLQKINPFKKSKLVKNQKKQDIEDNSLQPEEHESV